MGKVGTLVASFLAAASLCGAEVVVLKGGKRLEVVSFQQKGNYLVLVQAGGKTLSYPLTAVDLEATQKANAKPEPVPETKAPETPKSPFAAAVAKPGTPAVAITDADVQKVPPVGEGGGQEGEKASPTAAGEEGVVVVGWGTRQGEEGQWQIMASLANRQKTAVQDVSVSVRVVGPDGKEVATGSNTYPGTVQPGQEFTVPVTVATPVAPEQVFFSVNWRQLKPAVEEKGSSPSQPSPTPAPKGGKEKPSEGGANPGEGTF